MRSQRRLAPITLPLFGAVTVSRYGAAPGPATPTLAAR